MTCRLHPTSRPNASPTRRLVYPISRVQRQLATVGTPNLGHRLQDERSMNDLVLLILRYNPATYCGEHQRGRCPSLPGMVTAVVPVFALYRPGRS